jgi:hypothetical protein
MEVIADNNGNRLTYDKNTKTVYNNGRNTTKVDKMVAQKNADAFPVTKPSTTTTTETTKRSPRHRAKKVVVHGGGSRISGIL